MKGSRTHLPNFAYVAAFIIGVVLFASVWKIALGRSSSMVVLAGMAGTAVVVIVFWLWNELRDSNGKHDR